MAGRVLRAVTVVQLLVRLTAGSGRTHQLADALRKVKRQIQGQPGASRVYVAWDVDEADVLWFCEEWQDLTELEGHLRTAQFARLLALIETATQQPLVEFRVVSETRGLEYVASVRARLAE